MADKKISQLPPAAALTGDELVPVVQSGVTLQSTAGAIRGTAASLPGFDDAAEAVADDVLAAHTGAADPHPQYATPAEAAAAAPVQSVAGQIGAVVLLKSDVGLGSVDNTADIDKPVSTATLSALAGKQATLVSGTTIKSINGESLLGAGNLEIAGAGDVDGNTVKVTVKSLTRAQLDAAAADALLAVGEPYLITDEDRIAVGTSASAYASFAKEGEVAAPVEVVAPPVNVSPASGATEVSRTATLTGGSYSSSTGVAQGAVRAQVSATSDFSGALLYDSGEKPPSNTVAIPSGTLSNSSSVYWRVAYKSASGLWSDWSLPTVFTTRTADLVMTGGTVTSVGGYNIHTFTGSGSLVVPEAILADVLVVAGGGSGGNGVGGGGGGGGVQYRVAQALSAGTYAVTVGAGGAAAVGDTSDGKKGGSSSIGTTVTAVGGGGGGGNTKPGLSGGSGGGGAGTGALGGAGTASQGYAGGSGSPDGIGSGGGGGGQAGKNSLGGTAGAGGAGFACGISPVSTHYAGGGGGAVQTGYGTAGGAGGSGGGGAGAMTNGFAGTANRGGGGGGGGYDGAFYAGGAGGSGIVIVRYLKE